MIPRLPLRACLLALTVGMLLFAQITGMHHHFHREGGTPVHGHASELHFGDAGLHADEHHAAVEDPAAAHHAHGDVEVKALGDPLKPLSFDLLPIGLLVLITLLAPLRFLRSRRVRDVTPAIRPHPFALHPPANGPPALTFQLV